MMREMLWKEWRENRWKYVTLWLVFNLPILILAVSLACSRAARSPFADLSNQTFMKYLPLPLFESVLVASAFLLATGFVGLATFLPEVEDKSLFFYFEQPRARWRYALAKLAAGGAQVALAVVAACLLAPAAVYGMMLLGGKVSAAGSAPAFGVVMAGALRGGLWCALVSIACFAGCALIGSVVPRWWLATPCVLAFAVLFANAVMGDNRFFAGGNVLDMFPDAEGTYTVTWGFGTGHAEWLTVSGNLPLPTAFAHWHLLPVLTPIVLTCLFAAGLAWAFERKELQ